MTEMNLSLSTPEKKQEAPGVFSRSIIVVVSIFFVMLALWGGMRWYLKSLDETLTVKKALLEENSLQLQGESVDRVASFDTRLTLAKKQVNDNTTDTAMLLNQLESLIIPNVQLTKYEFNKKEKFVLVEGVADNFKYVAQQLISFKGENLFTNIKVNSLKKTTEGRIAFSFKAEIN